MASEVRGRNHYKKADAAVRFSTVVLITRRAQMNFFTICLCLSQSNTYFQIRKLAILQIRHHFKR